MRALMFSLSTINRANMRDSSLCIIVMLRPHSSRKCIAMMICEFLHFTHLSFHTNDEKQQEAHKLSSFAREHHTEHTKGFSIKKYVLYGGVR